MRDVLERARAGFQMPAKKPKLEFLPYQTEKNDSTQQLKRAAPISRSSQDMC